IRDGAFEAGVVQILGGVLTTQNAQALVAQGTDVVIPEGVTSIGSGAFLDTLLSSVDLPSTLTSIGIAAFAGTRLTSVVIPEGVTSIGDGAFAGADLSSLSVPDTLQDIGGKIEMGPGSDSITGFAATGTFYGGTELADDPGDTDQLIFGGGTYSIAEVNASTPQQYQISESLNPTSFMTVSGFEQINDASFSKLLASGGMFQVDEQTQAINIISA
ncbi:leucine-rich repeat domain-containing protein, partial [Synechococcus sp. AH-224-I15]|nr:leucine-rich repeat domain-containing protein [Synechococcus sp. AH-224-I15]